MPQRRQTTHPLPLLAPMPCRLLHCCGYDHLDFVQTEKLDLCFPIRKRRHGIHSRDARLPEAPVPGHFGQTLCQESSHRHQFVALLLAAHLEPLWSAQRVVFKIHLQIVEKPLLDVEVTRRP